MGVERNKELVRKFYEEIINQYEFDLIKDYVALEAIENEEINESGSDSLKKFYQSFRSAFPDFQFSIEDMIAEDDKVVVRMIVTGTHNGNGEFMGFTPQGNKIKVETIDIIRFEGEMMVEHWGKTDTLGMIQQLDLEPTPETIANIRSAP